MGQRYVQEYDENANVIDPTFWLENHNTYAGEFNGGLDRDNLPQATIAAAEVNGRPFTVVHGDGTATGFSPDQTNTDWQGGAGTGASGIDAYTWTAAQDAHYDAHVSVAWTWGGGAVPSWVQTGTAGDRPTATAPQVDIVDTISFRLTVDGVVLAVAGPFDDTASEWATYLIGSIQLPAGTHTLKLECATFRRKWQESGPAEGPCTYAVTINDRTRTLLERRR